MTVNNTKISTGPGRPRAFDQDVALDAALQLFRDQGYEATSLSDLTQAMGISRSSFYASFGSKRDVLLSAIKRYSARGLAILRDVQTNSTDTPSRALLTKLANPDDTGHGCLVVNCISELAPGDAEIQGICRGHVEQLENLFAETLSPDDPQKAAARAGVLVSIALGALTLHKSGIPQARIDETLKQAEAFLT